MSDFITMKTIKDKNDLFTPKVIEDYKTGNLSLKTMQNTNNVFDLIYQNNYKFLNYQIPPFTIHNDTKYVKNDNTPVTSRIY